MNPKRKSRQFNSKVVAEGNFSQSSVCALSIEKLECRQLFASIQLAPWVTEPTQPAVSQLIHKTMHLPVLVLAADAWSSDHSYVIQAIVQRAAGDLNDATVEASLATKQTSLLIDLQDETIFRITTGDSDSTDAQGLIFPTWLDQETITIVSIAGHQSNQFNVTMADALSDVCPLDLDVELEYLLNGIFKQNVDGD